MSMHPEWFDKFLKSRRSLIQSVKPFPFDQPAETAGFLSCHENDYLRLSAHPKVIQARNEATARHGSGAMASVVYGGDHGYHAKFRKRATELMKAESCVITTAGWTANVGLVEAVSQPGLPIYIDINAHASLWDGAVMGAGKIIPCRHNKPDAMARIVKRYGPGVMIIDGYYSTHGAIADVPAYCDIAEANDCLLIVDEAHSFGMCGEQGGGVCVEQGCAERVPIRTVSLAKAVGGNGGCIVGGEEALYVLSYSLRSNIFSSSPPPSVSAGNFAALEVLASEPERAQNCHSMAARLRTQLNDAGIDTGPSQCQIVSMFFDGHNKAPQLYAALKEEMILTSVFLPPAVANDTSILRCSIYALMTPEDIDKMAEAIIRLMKRLSLTSSYRGKYRHTNGDDLQAVQLFAPPIVDAVTRAHC